MNYYQSSPGPEGGPRQDRPLDPWELPCHQTSPAAGIPPTGQAPPRRKRRGLFVLALFIMLILGCTVGLAVFQGTSLLASPLERVFGSLWEQPGDPGFGQWDEFYYPELYDTPDTPTTIERAPTDPGRSLTLAQAAGPELSFQAVYEKVLPSIVSIEGSTDQGYYLGTGVVMSDDGYIITNHHVIDGCSHAYVTLHNGQRYAALLVGSDAESDLALLKINADGLTPAEFCSSELLRVGDTALAIGNPLGSELFGTMTDGIISAINRYVNVEGYDMALIQTTAAINPGNSGGALVNTAGQVVGITNMKMMSSYETIEGLGFAIPTTTVKTVVDTLLAEGAITGRPVLGISCLSLQEGDGAYYGLDSGVYVSTVTSGGPAEQAGLQPGDIITAANGTLTPDLDTLSALRDEAGVGGTLELTVWRDGETLELTLTLMDQYQLD